MFGLEIVGAVAAAAALIELSSKCTKKLVQIKEARDDATARDLLKRVELLTETISDVFKVLHEIYTQPVKQHQLPNAEGTIWERMKSVLLLCQQQLEDLYKQLNAVAAKTDGLVDRSKEAFKLSISLSNMKRIKEDIDTYINALNMLKGLLQILATHRQSSLQRVMHRDIIEIKENHGDKLEDALRGISQIQQELRQQSPHLVRTDSGQCSERTLTKDDPSDILSVYLEQIVIAAADYKESINDPVTYSPSSAFSMTSPSSPPNSSTVSNLADTQSLQSLQLPVDSLPDITHAEPLKELADRFKRQAETDFEHGHYQSAEFHQLESIRCHEELHDAHSIMFETFQDMKMRLAEIFRKQRKFREAEKIAEHRGPLRYDSDMGCRAVPLEIDEDADWRALRSEFMANIRLEMYQSGSSSAALNDAEKHAKRAFHLRREIYGRDSLELKTVVKILVKIYTRDPKKAMYAETYRELYLSNSSRQHSIALSPRTSRASSIPPPTSTAIIEAIDKHTEDDEHQVAHMIDDATHAGVDLDAIVEGRSAMIVAIDHGCDRCVNIIDKLLRCGAGRDVPFQHAVKRRNIARCSQLLRFDAHIDWLDTEKMTPLMNAIKREHADMVEYLISEHASLNIPGDGGRTALHMAIETRNVEILKLLLAKKDDLALDSTDNRGLTALHYCAKINKPVLAKKLIRAGADLEVRDKSAVQRTALWIAVKEGKYPFAETLLKLNAKVDMTYLPPSAGDMRNLLRQYINNG